MKNILVILIILTSSCSKPQKDNAELYVVSDEIKDTSTHVMNQPVRTYEIEENTYQEEVLHSDSVWLNDLIKYSTTKEDVLANLGEPDSITTPNYECGAYIAGEEPWGDTVNIWHYSGAELVVFRNRAELIRIKPIGWEWTLHHPKIIFSGNTTLNDLKDIFPNSIKNSFDNEDVNDGKTYKLVRIAPRPNWDDAWVLKFYQDKLVEIEYWTPC